MSFFVEVTRCQGKPCSHLKAASPLKGVCACITVPRRGPALHVTVHALCFVQTSSDDFLIFPMHSKTTQRNKQIAMGRKKFNMDPKKVREHFISFLTC